jgi:cell division protein FtsL
MILRLLNFVVIGALVLAAAYVYRVKLNSTVQAEHLAKLRSEVRHQRDTIAALRAEWGELDNPSRIEALAKRYLQLRPTATTQFDTLDHLPDRPPEDAASASGDPIGGMIGDLEEPASVTGSIPASTPATDPAASAPSPKAVVAPPPDSRAPAANGAPNP